MGESHRAAAKRAWAEGERLEEERRADWRPMCRAGESGGESLSTQFMESILRPLLLLKQTKILLCEGGESSIDMLHSEELRKAFEQCLIQCFGYAKAE